MEGGTLTPEHIQAALGRFEVQSKCSCGADADVYNREMIPNGKVWRACRKCSNATHRIVNGEIIEL